MFKSHLISMVIFSGIISVLMAFLKQDKSKAIFQYGAKLFMYMIGGVILGSWFMHFL